MLLFHNVLKIKGIKTFDLILIKEIGNQIENRKNNKRINYIILYCIQLYRFILIILLLCLCSYVAGQRS